MVPTDWAQFNHLASIDRLANRFHILRHGRSQANARGVVASAPGNALEGFGLTPEGARQVETTIRDAQAFLKGTKRTGTAERRGVDPERTFRGLRRLRRLDHLAVYSSPYRRALETAAIATRLLGTKPAIQEDRLRERFFGELELGPADRYPEVWRADAADPSHNRWGVESVLEVLDRATAAVLDIDRSHTSKEIVLVTHCDVAMILLCGWRRVDPRGHFRGGQIRTGELRTME
jgi:probable phosphoglycerate mutase